MRNIDRNLRCRAAPALAAAVASLVLAAAPAAAQWTTVSPGVEYAEFSESGPNRAYVVRVSRTAAGVALDTMIAQGKLSAGRETVSGMVARHDDALTWWGRAWGGRYEIVAAINGSFFDLTTGVPEGGMVVGGTYAKRFPQMGGGSGMVWKVDASAFLGGCVSHPRDRNYVTWADGTTQEIDSINEARGDGELVLYTIHRDADTGTSGGGIEVDVALDMPLLIRPQPSAVEGRIAAVRDGSGSTPVLFDHVIVSASGDAAATVRAHARAGDTVGITQELRNYARSCATTQPGDWTHAFGAVNAWPPIVENGSIPCPDGGSSFCSNVAWTSTYRPRTATALNDSYVYLVVVDGDGMGGTVGMNFRQLAEFCVNRLAATWAVSHDGGGSSAIWVDGSIRNRPSDGSERTVANGLFVARVLPADFSTMLGTDDTVETTASTELRHGPGTQYPTRSTLAAGQAGLVLAHPANGALARGHHWWLCEFSGTPGWVAEGSLRRTGGPGPDADADADADTDADADADAPSDVPAETPPDVVTPDDVGPGTDASTDGWIWVYQDDGCGCRATGGSGAGGLAAFLAAVGLLGAAGGRRRRRVCFRSPTSRPLG
ncbi:MAG: phosphodiester glycosidase family protein [Deltaproteobacteria bacterium]|nr:phosphodiester glycosidase family protein [Deltaproteobacteria bacterium]